MDNRPAPSWTTVYLKYNTFAPIMTAATTSSCKTNKLKTLCLANKRTVYLRT